MHHASTETVMHTDDEQRLLLTNLTHNSSGQGVCNLV